MALLEADLIASKRREAATRAAAERSQLESTEKLATAHQATVVNSRALPVYITAAKPWHVSCVIHFSPFRFIYPSPLRVQGLHYRSGFQSFKVLYPLRVLGLQPLQNPHFRPHFSIQVIFICLPDPARRLSPVLSVVQALQETVGAKDRAFMSSLAAQEDLQRRLTAAEERGNTQVGGFGV